MGNSSSHTSNSESLNPEEFYNQENPHVNDLFNNNRQWVSNKLEQDPKYFDKMKVGQTPKYFWVGCSDSRVTAESITGCEPGEMFIHRNIANLVVSSDINFLSVLQFAVEHIHVQDIIVCGHYGCGGVHAAMSNKDYGLLDNWLRNIRDVYRIHNDELRDIHDAKSKYRRLVELNVVEQCINILKNGIVQRHQAKYGYPRVHAVVYDIENGLLKELKVNFRKYIDNYEDIYRLYPFQTNGHSSIQAKTIADVCNGKHDERGRINKEKLREILREFSDVVDPTELENAIQQSVQREDGMVSIDQVISYFSDMEALSKTETPTNDEEKKVGILTKDDSFEEPILTLEEILARRKNKPFDTSQMKDDIEELDSHKPGS